MCGRFRRKTAPTWRELFDYYSVLPNVRDQIDEEDVSGEVKPTDAVPIMAHRHGERREVFSVAGLWEWNSHIKTPDWSNGILSCAMITTAPNERTAEFHNRMPAILLPEQYDDWLSPGTDLHQALEMLQPYSGDDMRIHACKPVTDDNSPRFL